MNGSDAELADLLRRDPERGGKVLFERHAKNVRVVLVRLLGPDSEVADLVHEVFLTALTSIHRLHDDSVLRSWLTGIAINKARNLVRQRRYHPFMRLENLPDLPDRRAFPSALDTSDAWRRTYRLLLRLPTEERAVFTLKQVYGMEVASIAKEMHVSVSTVKRKASHAQDTFVRWAQSDGALAEWLERGNLMQERARAFRRPRMPEPPF